MGILFSVHVVLECSVHFLHLQVPLCSCFWFHYTVPHLVCPIRKFMIHRSLNNAKELVSSFSLGNWVHGVLVELYLVARNFFLFSRVYEHSRSLRIFNSISELIFPLAGDLEIPFTAEEIVITPVVSSMQVQCAIQDYHGHTLSFILQKYSSDFVVGTFLYQSCDGSFSFMKAIRCDVCIMSVSKLFIESSSISGTSYFGLLRVWLTDSDSDLSENYILFSDLNESEYFNFQSSWVESNGVLRSLQFQHAPGHLVGLLQIIVANNVDLSIRQVASIYLKNVSAREWTPRKPGQLSTGGWWLFDVWDESLV